MQTLKGLTSHTKFQDGTGFIAIEISISQAQGAAMLVLLSTRSSGILGWGDAHSRGVHSFIKTEQLISTLFMPVIKSVDEQMAETSSSLTGFRGRNCIYY